MFDKHSSIDKKVFDFFLCSVIKEQKRVEMLIVRFRNRIQNTIDGSLAEYSNYPYILITIWIVQFTLFTIFEHVFFSLKEFIYSFLLI